MNSAVETKSSKVVAIIAIIWNALGLFAFVAHLALINNPEMLSQLSEAEQSLYNAQPTWYVLVFAMAVIGGFLGSILLLLRKPAAFVLFALSLLGIIGQQIYLYALSSTLEVVGVNGMIMPSVVLLVAIFLLYYSHKLKQNALTS